MPTTDAAGPSGPENLQAVLSGLDRKAEQLDDRARQQAALLAFGRRTNARPPVAVLMEDAAAMVAEIAAAERIGVGEVVRGGDGPVAEGGPRRRAGRAGRTHGRRVRHGADASMAGYALKRAPRSVARTWPSRDAVRRRVSPRAGRGQRADRSASLQRQAVRRAGDLRQPDSSSSSRRTSSLRRRSPTCSPRRWPASGRRRNCTSNGASPPRVLDLVDTLVLTLDVDGRVVGMNRATQKITGFSMDEIRDRPFWSVFVAPEDAELVQGIFHSSRSDRAPCEFEGYLLAKDGRRKRVSWSMKLMADGNVQSVILSGVDQTEKLQTRAELEQVKAIAQRAAKRAEGAVLHDRRRRAVRRPSRRPVRKALSALGRKAARTPCAPSSRSAARRPSNSGSRLRRAYRYRQKIAPIGRRRRAPARPVLRGPVQRHLGRRDLLLPGRPPGVRRPGRGPGQGARAELLHRPGGPRRGRRRTTGPRCTWSAAGSPAAPWRKRRQRTRPSSRGVHPSASSRRRIYSERLAVAHSFNRNTVRLSANHDLL